jgi:hypothetical protein
MTGMERPEPVWVCWVCGSTSAKPGLCHEHRRPANREPYLPASYADHLEQRLDAALNALDQIAEQRVGNLSATFAQRALTTILTPPTSERTE